MENIKGRGSASQEVQYVPFESPDTLHSKAIIKLVDVYSEGEIEGLVDLNGNVSATDGIYFDGVPYAEAGVPSFEGVVLYNRVGTPDQSHISGFPSSTTYKNVSAQVFKASPVTRTITDPNTDDLKITIGIPALALYTERGDLLSTVVNLTIEGRSTLVGSNPYISLVTAAEFAGKTTSKFQRTYTIDNIRGRLGDPPWEIRIGRTTDDAETTNDAYDAEALANGTKAAKIANDTYWDGYTIIINQKMQYTDTAYTACEFDASKLSANVPVRSYHVKGVKVKVPQGSTTWKSTALERNTANFYDGVWGGTFGTAQWTDNPAWIYYDLLINDRYGLGVDESKIDKYALYTISKYCDEMVDDGYGGLEPRYTINCVINKQEDALSVINMLASAVHSMPFFSAGKCTIVQDAPRDVDYNVAPSNAIGDFNYSGTSLKTRYTVVNVTWNNPKLQYEQDIETVEDTDGILKYGYNVKDIVAYGCTSRGQAHRYGKWILYTELHQTTTITYTAGLDHIMAIPGEIIQVQDPHKAAAKYGGRLKLISGSTLTLDREIDLSDGHTYSISVVLSKPNRNISGNITETIETKSITTPAGKYTSVDISGTFTSTPIVNAMWIISGTDVVPQKFRIVGVKPNENNTFEVSALSYNENKFRAIEDIPLLEEIPYTKIDTGAISAPENVVAVEFAATSGTNVAPGILLSWDLVDDPRVLYYEIEMKKTDTEYVPIGTAVSNSYEKLNLEENTYNFRVRAVSPFGKSIWGLAPALTVHGVKTTPLAVKNFAATPTIDGVDLTWTAEVDPFVSGYEVRHGTDWNVARVIIENFKGGHIFEPITNDLPQTYMIKPVSYWGVYGSLSFVTTSLLPPDIPTSFIAKKQDDFIYFKWNKVEGNGVEYEIRAGGSWEAGEFVLRTAGDSITELYPSEESVKFWIKSISAGSVYSTTSLFYLVDIGLVQNRNVIIEQNERSHGTSPVLHWTGNKVNMTVNTNDDLEMATIASTGQFWGAYNFDVALDQNFKARNWLDVRLQENAANITWAEADFAWNSVRSQEEGWVVHGDIDNIRLKKYIYKKALETVDKPLYFGIPLNGDYNVYSQGTNNGTSPAVDISSKSTFADVRIKKGLYFNNTIGSDTLNYAKNIALTGDFSIGFKLKFKGPRNVSKAAPIIQLIGNTPATDPTLQVEIIPGDLTTASSFKFLNKASDSGATTGSTTELTDILGAVYYNVFVNIFNGKMSVYVYSEEFDKLVTVLSEQTLVGLPGNNSSITIVPGTYNDGECVISDISVGSSMSSVETAIEKVKSLSPMEYKVTEELYVGDYEYKDAIVDITVNAPNYASVASLYKCKMFVDVPDIVEAGETAVLGQPGQTGVWTEITLAKEYNKIIQFIPVQSSGTVVGLAMYDSANVVYEDAVVNGKTKRIVKIKIRIASTSDILNVSASLAGSISWQAIGY